MPSSGSRSTQIRASRHCSPPPYRRNANGVSDRARGLSGGLVLHPGEDVPRSFVPAEIPVPRFDQSAMRDIDTFVRLFGSELMFVYGENDPTTAEAFRLGPPDQGLVPVRRPWREPRRATGQRRCRRKPSRLSAAGQVCNKTASDAASVQPKWPCGRRGAHRGIRPRSRRVQRVAA